MLLVFGGCASEGDGASSGDTQGDGTGPGTADDGPGPGSNPAEGPGSDDAIDSGDTATVPDLGPPPTACQMACENRETCLGESVVACGNTCDADHATHTSTGAECIASFETLLGCVAALSCDDMIIYADPPAKGEYPCSVEDGEFNATCFEPPPDTCEAYCALLTTCEDITPSECSAGCTMQIEFAEGLSEECGAAQTMLLECIGTLDCKGYETYLSGEGEYPCSLEDDASQLACEM